MGKGDTEIELVSGSYLDLLDPDPKLMTAQVIGWHLSQQNRYAGACRRPYSVAEHAMLVARRLETTGEEAEVVMAGLHHDDAEAFLGDLTRPLKAQLLRYCEIEDLMMAVIWHGLGLARISETEAMVVKDADNWALAAEAWYLMPSRGEGWYQTDGLFDRNDPDQYRLCEGLRQSPRALIDTSGVAHRWLKMHKRLKDELK